ncbi:MAG TPA: gamma-glutamyltransferase family protein [Acetobacteraceae bacterium]|nr:gamma-glutamyltransferase family protein [Acetobacteraceae bacterium]
MHLRALLEATADMPLESTRTHWLHDKTEACASRGMVSSRHPLSAEAGLEILRAGGNAVDAAIAASFAESVVQPAASTIGGGGLMIVRTPSGQSHSIDYLWQTPGAAAATMFPTVGTPSRGLFGWSGVKDALNEIGGLAAAVPGSVAGLAAASEQFGRLKLADVLEPAIRLARDGFDMDWYGSLMASIHLDVLKRFPTTARMLLRDGLFPPRPKMIGQPDRHRQPELAATLSAIAEGGPRALYTGHIARSIVDAMRAHGGIMTLEDLAGYEAKLGRTRAFSYREHQISGHPISTIYEQVLNVLSRFDLTRYAPDSAGRLHIFIEVFRHCWKDRMKVEPDLDQPDGIWTRLLSASYADRLARSIDRNHRSDIPSQLDGLPADDSAGHGRTVHVAAIDGDGGMASLTETVIGNYGCCVMSETGVLLNNGMISFAPVPGYPNAIKPGRRPASFMSPLHVIGRDGAPVITIGSSGGVKIMTSVLQIILYILDHGMSPQKAVSFPRIDFEGDKVILDARYDGDVLRAMRAAGHDVEVRSEGLSTFEFGNPSVLARGGDGLIRGGVNPYQATTAVGFD